MKIVSEEHLEELLKKLEKTTSLKSIGCNVKEIELIGKRINGKIHWMINDNEFNSISEVTKEIKEMEKDFPDDISLKLCGLKKADDKISWRLMLDDNVEEVFKTKDSYSSLFERLKEYESNFTYMDTEVLVFANAEIKKIGNKYLTKWIKIDPLEPYFVENDSISFNTTEIMMDEQILKKSLKTKLMFRRNDQLYIIGQEAFFSIGRIFDCTMAFKNMDEHMLGSALLIAEKLNSSAPVNAIVRKESDDIYSIISLCGKKYSYISQYDFFKKAMDKVAEIGIYEIIAYKVSNAYTEVHIKIKNLSEDTEIIISTGDLYGEPYRVQLCADFQERKIILKENSISHKKEIDYDLLFYGISDALEKYQKDISLLMEKEIELSIDKTNKIFKEIGKKNSNLIEDRYYGNGYELYKKIVNSIPIQPTKQEKCFEKWLGSELIENIKEKINEKY